MSVVIEMVREDWADPAVPLPDYATAGAAEGRNLRANLQPEDRAAGLSLQPGCRVLVPTGLRVAIPRRPRDADQAEGRVWRSSMALAFPTRPARSTAIIAGRWA